jgi:hypothetical protein
MKYLILLLFMANFTVAADTVYQWKNAQGNVEFSSEKPPLGIEFETIDMETREREGAAIAPVPASMSNVAPGIPVTELPKIVPSMTLVNPEITMSPPSVTPPVAAQDEERYQRVEKDLREICDHLANGSLERRKCRADAKQIFHDKCHDKDTPVSELYRRAYCSLSDNYPIVE